MTSAFREQCLPSPWTVYSQGPGVQGCSGGSLTLSQRWWRKWRHLWFTCSYSAGKGRTEGQLPHLMAAHYLIIKQICCEKTQVQRVGWDIAGPWSSCEAGGETSGSCPVPEEKLLRVISLKCKRPSVRILASKSKFHPCTLVADVSFPPILHKQSLRLTVGARQHLLLSV